jgi:hypothetical protein
MHTRTAPLEEGSQKEEIRVRASARNVGMVLQTTLKRTLESNAQSREITEVDRVQAFIHCPRMNATFEGSDTTFVNGVGELQSRRDRPVARS